MSRNNGSDTLISWLHTMTVTSTFRHVKTTILTESYSNSGLAVAAATAVKTRRRSARQASSDRSSASMASRSRSTAARMAASMTGPSPPLLASGLGQS